MPTPTDASLRIAAAQSISIPGDVRANVAVHQRFVAVARDAGVAVLVFPELSLSGYELPRLGECIVDPDGELLAPLRAEARAARMQIVVGAPLAPPPESSQSLPSIGAITFHPDGVTSIYRKQHLHGDEVKFASEGERVARPHRAGGETYALAICADITHCEHADAAAAAGASLYLAGVLLSESGYAADADLLRRHAAVASLGVLIANHGGPSGGWVSAGKSAFWAPGGELVVSAQGTGSQLVIATLREGHWSGAIMDVDATPEPA